jgi:hypothetical protein
VLYDPTDDVERPHLVLGAMLGNLGVQWEVPHDPQKEIPPLEYVLSGGGKMIRYNQDRSPIAAQNTTISAIATLRRYSVGRIKTDIALAQKKSQLGRELEAVEIKQMIEETQVSGSLQYPSPLCIISYENPHARIALRQDILTGPYDQRWGVDGDVLKRVFTGSEIQRLEAELARTSEPCQD